MYCFCTVTLWLYMNVLWFYCYSLKAHLKQASLDRENGIKSYGALHKSTSCFLRHWEALSVFVIEIPRGKKKKIYFPGIYLTKHIEKSAHHLECNQPSDGIILDSRLPPTRLSSTQHQAWSCANYGKRSFKDQPLHPDETDGLENMAKPYKSFLHAIKILRMNL